MVYKLRKKKTRSYIDMQFDKKPKKSTIYVPHNSELEI